MGDLKAKKKEDHWLKSIMSCPLCRGKEVMACYTPCRDNGGGMGECLGGCMTNNPMVLEMMLMMMPKSEPKKAPPVADELNILAAEALSFQCFSDCRTCAVLASGTARPIPR